MSDRSSLFGIGNQLYRKGDFFNAGLIYEYLAEIQGSFPYYKSQERLAKKKNGDPLSKKYHYKSANFNQKFIRIADMVSSTGQLELMPTILQYNQHNNPEKYLAHANFYVGIDQKKWIENINQYLSYFNIPPLKFKSSNIDFDRIFLEVEGKKSTEVDGPLVTICMSCYNVEHYVELAVRSLLRQTYKNIEILLFDDKSKDGTYDILLKLKKLDDRIRLVKNTVNQGTYITRNQAFKMAKGKYFTVLDGDDFALSNRIEMQVKHLENNIDHVGVVFKWVRMSINGKFEFRAWLGGNYLHEAVATMMIRRDLAIQKAGYWDSVRFAADTEYQYRLKRIFGNETLPTLDLPACISLSHPESLTNDKITGINTAVKGLSPIRLAYRESWKNWHEKTSRNDLYVTYPNIAREFEAPIEML